MSINLQNYKINRPFPRSPRFTVTGNEIKLLAKVVIMLSCPSGKRSENAGIHSLLMDSAVFTVS